MDQLRIILLLTILNIAKCAENAGTSVSPSLVECYNTTFITTRDNRLPATIAVLIATLRKAEDGNPSVNAREFAIQILQRFRQDGMWKNDNVDVNSLIGLPYIPKRWESFKCRVQLNTLTPGNAMTFNNNSLTLMERCSLHSMISSTIEVHERGDEATVCNRISRYTLRNKRELEFASERIGDPSTAARSDCPIESGVVYTKWGAIKAGLLISGIAAGLEQIPVPTENGTVDNRYASTISGELSEGALYQAKTDIKIGAKGGWNSTLQPKYYFLEEKDNLQVTDAEIRGGLDGLYLSLNVNSWASRFSNLKLSQIIDLYYSTRGVFDKSMRACNRQALETNQTSTYQLILQTHRFNYLLNEASVTNFSPYEKAFYTLAQNSVRSFNNYFPTMSDVKCPTEDAVIERAAIDLIIFLDTTWTYETIIPFLSYYLENIDVNKYETTYTIFNGQTGEIVVNKTTTILDFYQIYNKTSYAQQPSGFNYNKVVLSMEGIFRSKLDNATDIAKGQSTIALFIPHTTPSSDEKQQIIDRKQNSIKTYLPDLKILVVGVGSKNDYSDFVTSSNNDVFIINEGSNQDELVTTAKYLIERVKRVPRNVVNPACGSGFKLKSDDDDDDYTTFEQISYVEPYGRNYHRISPSYFYNGQDENRLLKIQGQGYGTLTVCLSRTEQNPANTLNNCKTINSDEISYDITNYCDDTITTCSPIYLSVEGIKSNLMCNDNNCRFPDNIRYVIRMENVGCASNSVRFIANFIFIISSLLLIKF